VRRAPRIYRSGCTTWPGEPLVSSAARSPSDRAGASRAAVSEDLLDRGGVVGHRRGTRDRQGRTDRATLAGGVGVTAVLVRSRPSIGGFSLRHTSPRTSGPVFSHHSPGCLMTTRCPNCGCQSGDTSHTPASTYNCTTFAISDSRRSAQKSPTWPRPDAVDNRRFAVAGGVPTLQRGRPTLELVRSLSCTSRGRTIRHWSAGCARPQYSVGIPSLVREFLVEGLCGRCRRWIPQCPALRLRSRRRWQALKSGSAMVGRRG